VGGDDEERRQEDLYWTVPTCEGGQRGRLAGDELIEKTVGEVIVELVRDGRREKLTVERMKMWLLEKTWG